MTESKKIDAKKIVDHWIKSSEDDFHTMKILFDAKSYHWALFLGHISTEKLLKAAFTKKFEKHAPFTHNLYRLAEYLEVTVSDEYSDWLDVITTFNLNARYDDHKKEFYRLCNKDYALLWMDRINELRKWIKEKL
jgi:HEPN domain-containing protein